MASDDEVHDLSLKIVICGTSRITLKTFTTLNDYIRDKSKAKQKYLVWLNLNLKLYQFTFIDQHFEMM